MRPIIIKSLFVLFAFGCGKVPDLDQIFSSDLLASVTEINADGATTVNLKVELNKSAHQDRRIVVFTTSGGTLGGTLENNLMVTANFENGKLIASTDLKAPMSAAKIIVTVKPANSSNRRDFIKQTSINVVAVPPAEIHLETSSSGIASNFLSTDTLVATLKTADEKKVSVGAEVIFEDSIPNFEDKHGRFRNQKLFSDSNSQVFALYSAPPLPIGTDIYIIVTIIESGIKSTKRDRIALTVNQ